MSWDHVSLAAAYVLVHAAGAYSWTADAAGRWQYTRAADPRMCMVWCDTASGARFACEPLSPAAVPSYSPVVRYAVTLRRRADLDAIGVEPHVAALLQTPTPRRWQAVDRPIPVGVASLPTMDALATTLPAASMVPMIDALHPAARDALHITGNVDDGYELDLANGILIDRIIYADIVGCDTSTAVRHAPSDQPTLWADAALAAARTAHVLELAAAGLTLEWCNRLALWSRDAAQTASAMRRVVDLARRAPWLLYAAGLMDAAGLLHQLRHSDVARQTIAARLPQAVYESRAFWAYMAAVHAQDVAASTEARRDVPQPQDADYQLALCLYAPGLYVPLDSGGFVPRAYIRARHWLRDVVGALARSRSPPHHVSGARLLELFAAGADVLLVDTAVPMAARVRQPPELAALRRHAALFVGARSAATFCADAVRAALATGLREAAAGRRMPLVVIGDVQWWSACALQRLLAALMTVPERTAELTRRPDGTYCASGGLAPFKLALCRCSAADDNPASVARLLHDTLTPLHRVVDCAPSAPGASALDNAGARLLEMVRLEPGNRAAWLAFVDARSAALYQTNKPPNDALPLAPCVGESIFVALRRATALSFDELATRTVALAADDVSAHALLTLFAFVRAVCIRGGQEPPGTKQ